MNKKFFIGIGWSLVFSIQMVAVLNAQTNDGFLLHKFEKRQLSSEFYGEGVGIGDLNGDGIPDIIAGPFWYEGPDYEMKHLYQKDSIYDRNQYSENFILEVEDVNEDGWNDILMVGFPGEEAYWFENPGPGKEGFWKRHLIHERVDNESPLFYDLDGDGKKELVFQTEGIIGYAKRKESATEPWEFIAISEQDKSLGRFTHGLGVGDVDGDGWEDIILAHGWWKNPGDWNSKELWEFHPYDFGPGGSQMYVYDVNGDGINDVITSLDAHGWGLAWYEQVHDENDGISFEKHLIMGKEESDNDYGIAFSELHAIEMKDMDLDGTLDIITGKRFWAHGPFGYKHHSEAAVLYWFQINNSDRTVEFVPHLIDFDSGVGTQIQVEDLTGNGLPDILVCNKKGTFVFYHTVDEVSQEVWEYMQPKKISDTK